MLQGRIYAIALKDSQVSYSPCFLRQYVGSISAAVHRKGYGGPYQSIGKRALGEHGTNDRKEMVYVF
ncbi:hypothetical protein SDC9_205180 [bioreactor metagenome]|uniref:Uncharacterized protein n=1 Tax=bioreactor metagenome TaxID=1076179 RepID=A0A645J209_9ZZZZ